MTPEDAANVCAILAERATVKALNKIRNGVDGSVELSLAAAAWSVVMGNATDKVREDMAEYELTDDDGYELRRRCICPPDLLARGGFKGGCGVHGFVAEATAIYPASPYPTQAGWRSAGVALAARLAELDKETTS
jgi:hypothetical protein